MTVAYRCTHRGCRARVTLHRRRERYARAPRCPNCRRELTGRPDWAMRRRDKRRRCSCDGYHWPHRKGSRWCRDSRVVLTDRDYEERYGRAVA